MTIETRLDKLNALARERSSQRRRDLLREVTDLFFDEPPLSDTPLQRQFDEILSAIATQTELDARAEIANKFADFEGAPRGLILQLARDAISVAAPILQRSSVLSEDDLVSIVHETGQDHMRAISVRDTVPEPVSNAIVERGDDTTVASLVSNEGAKLSRSTFETVAQRAEANPELQAPLAKREDTPIDLLNDLMSVVETNLRETITRRFEGLDPEVVEAALAASKKRLQARLEEDQDIIKARSMIIRKKMRGHLNGSFLASLLRDKQRTAFCVGFAELSGVDYFAARRALEHPSVDGLALICKAARIEKPLFVTLAVLREDTKADPFTGSRKLGELYDALTEEAAGRALRFMRMRRDAAA